LTIKAIVGSQILLRRACLPRLMRSRRPQAGISLITVSTAGITTNSGNISRLRICKGCSLMTPITGSSLRRSTGEARRTRLHTRTMGTGGGLRNRWTAAPTINEADRIGRWGRKGLGQEVSIGVAAPYSPALGLRRCTSRDRKPVNNGVSSQGGLPAPERGHPGVIGALA